MSTIPQIADQLRACNFEHARAVFEPDDVMVLIAYLEDQGFISAEAQVVLDAEKAEAEAEADADAVVQVEDEPKKKGKGK